MPGRLFRLAAARALSATLAALLLAAPALAGVADEAVARAESKLESGDFSGARREAFDAIFAKRIDALEAEVKAYVRRL